MSREPSVLNVKAVLFDVDGTLVDSLEMIIQGLGDAAEAVFNIRPPRQTLRDTIGTPLRDQAGMFAGRHVSDDEIRVFSRIAQESFDAHVSLEKDYEPALEALRLCYEFGIATCLVTSKSATELAGFMNRFSHASYVNATVCSSDVRNAKPAPDSALLACERLGVDPSEAVFIGDSLFDLRCAKAAGIANVAVSYGACSTHDLAAENPNLLLNTPEELLHWVQSAFLTSPCHAIS